MGCGWVRNPAAVRGPERPAEGKAAKLCPSLQEASSCFSPADGQRRPQQAPRGFTGAKPGKR